VSNLRVLVDGRPLLGPKAGIGQYIDNLMLAIHSASESTELYYYDGVQTTQNPALLGSIPQHLGFVDRWLVRIKRRLGVSLDGYEQWSVSRSQHKIFSDELRKLSPTVVHGTNYFIFSSKIPTVVTIYDISCFKHPETHPKERVAWHREYLPRALREAKHIIAISEFTKREVCEYFDVSPEKITVTYLGASQGFTPRKESEITKVVQKYNVTPGFYFLAVGTLEPRKNLRTHISAYATLRNTFKEKYPLVIAGYKGWGGAESFPLLEKLQREGYVRLLGYVPQEDLPYIYNGAISLLYPSIYEGFGLPPLEAMASGIPVAVSNRASLPEVVGDSGVLLDPVNVDAWANTMEQLVEDVQYREELASRALNQARKFSWTSCAAKTLQIYQQACEVAQ